MIPVLTLLAQTQSNPPSPSPETLNALAHLVCAVAGTVGNSTEWFTPAGITAIATLVSSIAWPVVVVVLVLVLRPQLRDVLHRVTEFEFLGIKGKVERELNQSAKAAERSEGLSAAPTAGERERAIHVERLVTNTDLAFVRRQVDELAAEYERVRGSMRASDTRTRAMEVVVSKMRTIGRAAYPLRCELSTSPSPGWRLQAIASLQILPDYDLLGWLAERVEKETPFVSYHAMVAMNAAANDERAAIHLRELKVALAQVQTKTASLGRDTDRVRQIQALQEAIGHLRD